MALNFQSCIRKVLGSNVGSETSCPEWKFPKFSSLPRGKVQDITWIMSWQISFESPSRHPSPVFLPLDTIMSEHRKRVPEKPQVFTKAMEINEFTYNCGLLKKSLVVRKRSVKVYGVRPLWLSNIRWVHHWQPVTRNGSVRWGDRDPPRFTTSCLSFAKRC